MEVNYFNIFESFKIKQLICFFLFVPFFMMGQNSVRGIVNSEEYKPIEGANVILKSIENNNIVAFTTTDKKGYFELQHKIKDGTYELKVSFLGFETIIQNIEIHEMALDMKTIILQESTTELNEIILKAENNGIIQKDDVTQYRIEKFLNGTEENLKDVINRLPGLGVNENGKITANGKEVDKLLIDGEDLYKRQHQFATENISSEMIKNIELIRNYKEFESINLTDKTGVTALNVSIKEDFKNRFTGNLEAYSGYKNKFRINTSVFNFSKKIKFSLIANTNNLGSLPISLEEYMQFTEGDKTSTKEEVSGVSFTNIKNLPRFLSLGTNVESINNKFITFSAIYKPNNKLKFELFTVYNNSLQNERFSKQTTLFSFNQNIDVLENNVVNERDYLGIVQLKSIYKFDERTILSNNTFSNIDFRDQEKNISTNLNANETLIQDHNQLNTIKFLSNFQFKKNLQNNILKSTISLQYDKFENQNEINSDQEFLGLEFENNNFSLIQFVNNQKTEVIYNIDYQLIKKNFSLDFFTETSFSDSFFSSNVTDRSEFNNLLNLQSLLSTLGIDYNIKINKILQYGLGINYNHVQNQLNGVSSGLNYVGIKSNLKAIFDNNNIAQITYNYSNKIAKIENLIENNIISDYRNLIGNKNIEVRNLYPYHQFNFNHFIFKPTNKWSFIFNASYISNVASLNNDVSSNENFSISQYALIGKDHTFSSFVFIEKEFKKFPIFMSGSIAYNLTGNSFFQDNIMIEFKSENYSGIFSLKSKFSQSILHFDTGIKFSKDLYFNGANQTSLNIYQPYVNLNGVISKYIFWSLNSSIINYIGEGIDRTIVFFSPVFKFRKAKSKWEFSLVTNNILNLDNRQSIQNSSISGFFEQRTTSILDGYITFGSKFKF